ncbi:hypothetical protein DEO72_LG11g1812 [Vigna unguiculata]|uniref:Uncharacterized protein n=1 Tax=Vigna unguiculata TaxID=3917 RepID=A0A4D6NME2_VIGUN|nr:hypothetical protein DEO72_LG11g1812 [Vigna unguiculata]
MEVRAAAKNGANKVATAIAQATSKWIMFLDSGTSWCGDSDASCCGKQRIVVRRGFRGGAIVELCTAATTEARGAATAALRGATRATLRGAATTEAPGAATAALRGVEVVVLVWTLVDQQMVNGEGFVAWRCGGVEARGAVNGEESKRRTAQNGDDALWRKTEKMNSANGSTFLSLFLELLRSIVGVKVRCSSFPECCLELVCCCCHMKQGTRTAIFAQVSSPRLGESSRTSPRSFARVLAQASELSFERKTISLKQDGLA